MRRIQHRWLKLATGLFLATAIAATAWGKPGQYLAVTDFLAAALGSETPPSGVVWVDDELRKQAADILGHAPGKLRIRYWYAGNRTAWVLEEIGKERPITMGVVIRNRQIEEFRVLEFRESRGWEIRYPFFADQFRGASRNADGQLDRSIDSISGATLSVRASLRTANFALLLDEYARRTNSEIER